MTAAINCSPNRKIRKTTSRAQIVLDVIKRKDGMTRWEILTLLMHMAGVDPEAREPVPPGKKGKGLRANRGWGSDRFSELSAEFLVQGKDKKWRLRDAVSEEKIVPSVVHLSKSFVARYEAERRRRVKDGGVAPPAFDKAFISVSLSRSDSPYVTISRKFNNADGMAISLTPTGQEIAEMISGD